MSDTTYRMYNFRTRHFGLTENELHLLRSGFPYKKVSFSEIENIEITKYHGTKNPVLLTIFGLSLIAFSFWFITADSTGFTTPPSEDAEIFQAVRGYGFIVWGLLFMIGLGMISLIQVFKLRWSLKIKFADNSREVLPIMELQKNNKTEELVRFLTKNFDTNQFRFRQDLLKSI